jgi:hypothetical protein
MRGLEESAGRLFVFACAVYNIERLRKVLETGTWGEVFPEAGNL